MHQVLDGGLLKELHKASGNDMGGGTVDAKFKILLRDTFGSDFWDKYEKKHPSEVQRMMFDFTTSKCNKKMKDVYIPCHFNLSTGEARHLPLLHRCSGSLMVRRLYQN